MQFLVRFPDHPFQMLICHLGHLEGMSTLLNTLQGKNTPFLFPKLVVIMLALEGNMYRCGLADPK